MTQVVEQVIPQACVFLTAGPVVGGRIRKGIQCKKDYVDSNMQIIRSDAG